MQYEKLFENFENVTTPQECETLGDAPSWLNGSLLRNGPGMFEIGNTKYKHWFDGMAYIERYHIVNGQMFYTARFLESEDYKDNMKAKRIVSPSFGTRVFSDPTRSILYRMSSYFAANRLTDNCNMAFVTTGEGVYALTESPLIIRIDIDTLAPVGKMDLLDPINFNLHFYSPHFHKDSDGTLYHIGSKYGYNSYYAFSKTKNPINRRDARKEYDMESTRYMGSVPADDPWSPCYYHSFAMTENYLVFFESPLRISLKKMIGRLVTGWSFQNCLYWDEHADVRVIICNHEGGVQPPKVTADAFFTFHHANAYEKDGFLVVDYVKYDNPGNLDALLLEHMRTGAFRSNPSLKSYLHRMIIPIKVSKDSKPGENLLSSCDFADGCEVILKEDGSIHCKDKRLCDIPIEFPRYCDDLDGRDYRYVYGTCLVHEPTENYGVVKVDVKHGEHKVWKKKNGQQLCAEPILVNKPGYTEEDEGVLIVPVVTVPEVDIPYVVLLDAQNMDELCRFLIPQLRIPLGFHSHYIPQQPTNPETEADQALTTNSESETKVVCKKHGPKINQVSPTTTNSESEVEQKS